MNFEDSSEFSDLELSEWLVDQCTAMGELNIGIILLNALFFLKILEVFQLFIGIIFSLIIKFYE